MTGQQNDEFSTVLSVRPTQIALTLVFLTCAYGMVVQRVECWTCDQQVVGSYPTKCCVTTYGKLFIHMCLCHQAV